MVLVWDIIEKRLYLASVVPLVREQYQGRTVGRGKNSEIVTLCFLYEFVGTRLSAKYMISSGSALVIR